MNCEQEHTRAWQQAAAGVPRCNQSDTTWWLVAAGQNCGSSNVKNVTITLHVATCYAACAVCYVREGQLTNCAW